jgi:hypothetical protein
VALPIEKQQLMGCLIVAEIEQPRQRLKTLLAVVKIVANSRNKSYIML